MEYTTLTLRKNNITDFAKERNKLLVNVKNKWVLFLDFDEKLDSPIKDISDKYDSYILRRKNYFLGKYIGTDNIIRLGKKNAGKWVRAVHETWRIKGKVGVLPNYIVHNTADNLHDYINKVNKYAKIHAAENFKERKKSNLFKIIFFPIGKFIFTLAKSKHIVFSILQAFHSFLAWSQIWLLTNKIVMSKKYE